MGGHADWRPVNARTFCAALLGVTVQIVNADTGLECVTVTDGTGTAHMPAPPPGTYRVTFELQGFTTVVQEGVSLRVGQTVGSRSR